MKQLTAAMNAIETAKALPATIARLTDAAENLRQVNVELISLKERLADLDGINERIEIATRKISDVQQLTEETTGQVAMRAILDAPKLAEAVEASGVTEELREVVRADSENWEQVSAIWRQVKADVEAKIDSLTDGRYRRKYNGVTRYQYAEIAQFLVNDRLLTSEQAQALNRLDVAFRSIRNRRIPVTTEAVAEFAASYELFSGGRRGK